MTSFTCCLRTDRADHHKMSQEPNQGKYLLTEISLFVEPKKNWLQIRSNKTKQNHLKQNKSNKTK